MHDKPSLERIFFTLSFSLFFRFTAVGQLWFSIQRTNYSLTLISHSTVAITIAITIDITIATEFDLNSRLPSCHLYLCVCRYYFFFFSLILSFVSISKVFGTYCPRHEFGSRILKALFVIFFLYCSNCVGRFVWHHLFFWFHSLIAPQPYFHLHTCTLITSQ